MLGKRKICANCGIKKSRDKFCKKETSSDGLFSYCRDCSAEKAREYRKRYRLKNPIPARPKPEKYTVLAKTCSKCSTQKAAQDFTRNSRNLDGLRSWCRACDKDYVTTARQSGRLNRDALRAAVKRWADANPDVYRVHNAYRRANKARALPPWETDAIAREREWRKRHPDMVLDHIVPISPPRAATLGGRSLSAEERKRFVGPLVPLVYGFHTEANWQPLSKSENSRKGNRDWPHAPWHE